MSSPDGTTRPKRRHLLRKLLLGFIAIILLAGSTSYWAIWTFCVAKPPHLDELPAVATAEIIEENGYRRLGDSYLRNKDGIMRMVVSGDPVTRGFTIGRLAEEYVELQERDFVASIRKQIPNDLALWLLKVFITIRHRDLPDYVRPEHQLELFGYVSAHEDKFAHLGPVFHRKLNYLAAHDIGHAVIDNPLVGCSAFAARGSYTANGHLLMGRTFDFDVARSFDTNKIVYHVKPDEGLDFIYVAWPGMLGVVSGMNEAKIAVTINAGHSDDKRRIGTPVALVARDIMQYSSTLDEAIERIRESQLFVNESFLLAEGTTGRAVVVEKTPLRCEVRELQDEHLVCANHFLSPTFQQDVAHTEYLAQGTSVVRYDRMETLLQQHKGALSPEVAAAILRDRVVPGSAEIPLGNPASINMLIATHAVIFDVTDGVMWVSAAPHQLGAFVPFGLENFEEPDGKSVIPADDLLSNGGYDRYLESRKLMDTAQQLLDEGEFDAAFERCAEAQVLTPNDYRIALLQTQVAFGMGEWEKVIGFGQIAKEQYVAYGNERNDLTRMLNEANAKRGNL